MLATLMIALACGSAPHRIEPVPIPDVAIDDAFWAPKLEIYRTKTIADVLGKFEKDGAIRNFDRVRDGLSGEHGGPQWYDGLIYEMIRAGADFIAARPDPALERRLDGIIEHIAAAAAKDPAGYINTHTQLVEPGHRWGMDGGNDNDQHDVYNAGALVDAGVHYYEATGKTRLLRVAARLANHMCDTMGPPPRKNVVPGHSIAEEAVIGLHRLFRDTPRLKQEMPFPVDEARYLALVEFWIENRGRTEGRVAFGSYGQDHLPVLEQPTIEGGRGRWGSEGCTGPPPRSPRCYRSKATQCGRRSSSPASSPPRATRASARTGSSLAMPTSRPARPSAPPSSTGT